MIRHYLKAAVAFALVALTAAGAYALNVDQTRVMNKRYLGIQAVHYYRLSINYNDPRFPTAQMFGALGQYSYIARVMCYVNTTFNAGTTNTISLGTSLANANEILAASGASTAACSLSSATQQDLTTATGLGLNVTSAGDVTLYTKLSLTGTAATQGQVTMVIEFIPNNDM